MGGKELTLPSRYKEGCLKTGLLRFVMAAIASKASLSFVPKGHITPLPPRTLILGSSDAKPCPLSYALRRAIADIIMIV
jgi:hypothetical protein